MTLGMIANFTFIMAGLSFLCWALLKTFKPEMAQNKRLMVSVMLASISFIVIIIGAGLIGYLAAI